MTFDDWYIEYVKFLERFGGTITEDEMRHTKIAWKVGSIEGYHEGYFQGEHDGCKEGFDTYLAAFNDGYEARQTDVENKKDSGIKHTDELKEDLNGNGNE